MLAQQVNALSTIELKEMNEISMSIARELVEDGFDMKSLADVESHIMDLASDRMLEQGCKFDKEEDAIYLAGLVIEISLYFGINIGRNLNK